MGEQGQASKDGAAAAAEILQSMVGRWEGTSQTWFEPGKPPETAPVRGTIRRLGESRFVLHEYQSSLGGQAFEGAAIYGFNVFSGAFESAWADSFHMPTNIMLSSGLEREPGFSVLGSYQYDPQQPAWGWRTQVEVTGADSLTITAYNVTPQGEAFKAIETVYRRATVFGPSSAEIS